MSEVRLGPEHNRDGFGVCVPWCHGCEYDRVIRALERVAPPEDIEKWARTLAADSCRPGALGGE